MEHQWKKEDYIAFRSDLISNRDEKYRIFHEKLLRSSLPVIGIRIPILRKEAKEVAKVAGKDFFLVCEKDTYEERLLYGLVAPLVPMEFDEFLFHCDKYANEYVENWAHCDVFCGSLKKIVAKNEVAFFDHTKAYLKSENPWVVRVGVVIFLSHYLKDPYLEEVLRLVDEVHSDFYYIEMGQAWLLATAWAKNPEMVRNYLDVATISYAVKAKFVQKACESFRVSDEDKTWLRKWKELQKQSR